jgi:hypothetical protein
MNATHYRCDCGKPLDIDDGKQCRACRRKKVCGDCGGDGYWEAVSGELVDCQCRTRKPKLTEAA